MSYRSIRTEASNKAKLKCTYCVVSFVDFGLYRGEIRYGLYHERLLTDR